MPGVIGDSNGEKIKASRGKLSTTVKYKAYSSSTYDPNLGSKVSDVHLSATWSPTCSQLHQECQSASRGLLFIAEAAKPVHC